LLIMPKSRAVDAEFAANAAADSAEFGDVVPPRPGEAPRRSHGSTGRDGGHSGAARTSSRPPRERKPFVPVIDHAAVSATEAPVAVAVHQTEMAPGVPPAAGNEATEGTPKPRRRRGGRNRRREGAAADGVETNGAAAVVAEGGRAPRGERRPSRERSGAESTGTGSNRPSRQVAVTSGKAHEHAHPKKPGLFRRLTRLFTGR
jgi:ATP-dependent RNA helicase RhlB